MALEHHLKANRRALTASIPDSTSLNDMNTLTRKQRELQQREAMFIDLAREMINEQGLQSLTMEKLAEKAEYSKGTLYKHFCCKEDVLAAICTEKLVRMADLFQSTLTLSGHSREKILALLIIYKLFSIKFPDQFDILLDSRRNDLSEKASPDRAAALNEANASTMATMLNIIEQGIQEGNLKPQDGLTTDMMCVGTWSFAVGLFTITSAPGLLKNVQLPPAEQVMIQQMGWLLDGYHWRPYSYEFDYLARIENIIEELQHIPQFSELMESSVT